MRTPLLLLIVVVTLLTSCEKASNLDAPRAFFSKNKIGSSPDYGVIKLNNPENHVITIHGFVDDLKSCLIVAEAMNKDACKETGGKDCLRAREEISTIDISDLTHYPHVGQPSDPAVYPL